MHKPALSICSPSVLHWIPKPIIDSIHIQSLLYLLLWFGVFNYKTCRNTSKDLGHNSRTSFLRQAGTDPGSGHGHEGAAHATVRWVRKEGVSMEVLHVHRKDMKE